MLPASDLALRLISGPPRKADPPSITPGEQELIRREWLVGLLGYKHSCANPGPEMCQALRELADEALESGT